MNLMRFAGKQELIPYEAKRREAAISVLNLAREYLANPEVQLTLGGFALDLARVAQLARVPDIIDGNLQDFWRYRQRNVVPFVLMKPGETLTTSMVEYGPLQQQRFIQDTVGLEAHEIPEALVGRPISINMPTSDNARTWGFPAEYEGYEYARSVLRPLVGIQLREDMRQMALTAIHEFSHVTDALRRPISNQPRDDLVLATETKAHSLAHAVDTLTLTGGQTVNRLPAAVARVTFQHNGPLDGPDAFRVDDELKSALIKNNLEYIWRPEMR